MGAGVTTRDDQTGLMNLGAFTFVVDHVVKRAARSGECATILSIALAPEPDTASGRSDTSPAAYYVARMLRSELRGEDVVARLGEREFGVALPDTDAEQGEVVAAWITDRLASASGPGTQFTVGRTTFDPTGGAVSCEALLHAARASCDGPSHLAGTSEVSLSSVNGADAPANRVRLTGRRHLRPLRSSEP